MEKQLKVEQIAEILGLAEDTVRDYFQGSRFPGAYKLNWEWRLSESDLERWIAFKKDPEGFVEKELQVRKAMPDYQAETDPIACGIMEYCVRQIWERVQYGKKKYPVSPSGVASFADFENKQ